MSRRVDKQLLASFQLCYCFVVVVVIVIIVWVRVIGVTVFISRNIFSLLLGFFQQAALISVMSWSFTVMARWFGSVSIIGCVLLAESVHLYLIRGFQTIQL